MSEERATWELARDCFSDGAYDLDLARDCS